MRERVWFFKQSETGKCFEGIIIYKYVIIREIFSLSRNWPKHMVEYSPAIDWRISENIFALSEGHGLCMPRELK